MAYAKIPLSNTPFSEQSFKISLKDNTVNVNIKLRLTYQDLFGVWVADVIDGESNKTLIACLPLVCGVDLLGQHSYLDIGEAYIIEDISTDLMHPDNTTLGKEFILVWGDDT